MKMFKESFPHLSQKFFPFMSLTILALLALLAGCGAPSSPPASSTNQSPASTAATSTNQAPASMTKGQFNVIEIKENSIQASFLKPQDQAGKNATILTTSSTSFVPDRAAVVVGKPIIVVGTLNNDGTITAELVQTEVPASQEVTFYGDVISIDGDTVVSKTDQGLERTFLLTSNTTFSRANEATKESGSATRSDFKVGVEFVVDGKFIDGVLVADKIIILEHPK